MVNKQSDTASFTARDLEDARAQGALAGEVRVLKWGAGFALAAILGALGLLYQHQILLHERVTRVEEQLVRVEERVTRVEEQLVRVEERVTRVEEQLVRVEERVTRVEERVTRVEERLVRVEGQLDVIEKQLATISAQLQALTANRDASQ